MARVVNHFKNPVVERQRTLTTEVMGFRAERLARVKTSSSKYQRTKFFRFEQYDRAYRNWTLQWVKRSGRDASLAKFRKLSLGKCARGTENPPRFIRRSVKPINPRFIHVLKKAIAVRCTNRSQAALSSHAIPIL